MLFHLLSLLCSIKHYDEGDVEKEAQQRFKKRARKKKKKGKEKEKGEYL